MTKLPPLLDVLPGSSLAAPFVGVGEDFGDELEGHFHGGDWDGLGDCTTEVLGQFQPANRRKPMRFLFVFCLFGLAERTRVSGFTFRGVGASSAADALAHAVLEKLNRHIKTLNLKHAYINKT